MTASSSTVFGRKVGPSLPFKSPFTACQTSKPHGIYRPSVLRLRMGWASSPISLQRWGCSELSTMAFLQQSPPDPVPQSKPTIKFISAALLLSYNNTNWTCSSVDWTFFWLSPSLKSLSFRAHSCKCFSATFDELPWMPNILPLDRPSWWQFSCFSLRILFY